MIPENVLQDIAARIHGIPELAGVQIGFHGNGQSRVLRRGFSKTAESAANTMMVIIEEGRCSSKAEGDELQRYADLPGGIPGEAPKPKVLNGTKVTQELVGAGAACGFAIISTFGLAAATAGTAGVGFFLAIGFWSAGAIQCFNGVVRAGTAVLAPEGTHLDRWDDNNTYKYTMLVVDAVDVAGGSLAIRKSAKVLMELVARRSALATQLTPRALSTMNRAQRVKVVSEAFEQTAQTKEGREALMEAAQAEGVATASLGRAGMSRSHAEKLTRLISSETLKQMKTTTREALLEIAGIGVSGTPETLTGSGSGSVYWMIHLIATGKT